VAPGTDEISPDWLSAARAGPGRAGILRVAVGAPHRGCPPPRGLGGPATTNTKTDLFRSVSLLASRHPSDQLRVAVQRPLLNGLYFRYLPYYRFCRAPATEKGHFLP